MPVRGTNVDIRDVHDVPKPPPLLPRRDREELSASTIASLKTCTTMSLERPLRRIPCASGRPSTSAKMCFVKRFRIDLHW
ncbi:hypothetical protein EV715DRAFT_298393 [Schizophyllum commune]